ncbi:MAG: hypothetical protein JOY90_16190 [Bradyrhizobium sp.]|uniref:hypothetical protein n=1 Tax=Bradyrhizobium sp. TaxID=376 RepID=UPI001D35C837|nr:hypothetical protein [Bradyrhizobium sp.]MBV9561965.1 hypothetical protein [Bradyrhizobium sp.]
MAKADEAAEHFSHIHIELVLEGLACVPSTLHKLIVPTHEIDEFEWDAMMFGAALLLRPRGLFGRGSNA